jgi:hemoglobin
MSEAATATPYERIGGEAGVRRLVRRFYELMDTLPEAGAARAIHGADLGPSEEKLFLYLTGWLGGPQLFVEKYGHPMLRRRHLRAPIAGAEVTAWLTCFRRAWAECVTDAGLTAVVLPQIENLARHMRNREDPG